MDFTRIENKKALLDALRPLPEHTVKSLHEKLVVEWTYNSNAIEGNTLTLQETKVVIEDGITVGGKSLTEHLEAINHKDAIGYLEEVVRGEEPFTGTFIKNLHQLVLKDIDDDNAGAFRKENVTISGARHVPPDFTQLSGEMEELIRWYNEEAQELHPVERAAFLHSLFVKIHPFVDGNGRTARLLLNFELLKSGYVPLVIKKEDRLDYYKLLDTAHTTDNHDEFIRFVAMLAEIALDNYLAIVQPMGKVKPAVEEDAPVFKEDHISQIPALHLLMNMGYTYLTQDEVYKQRQGKQSNVLLEGILAQQLRFINSFTYKGRRNKFTEGAISGAVQALKAIRYDGLGKTNELLYDLLCLGKSFEQTVEGDTKSFTLNFIDWNEPANNVFHVAAEYAVERAGSYKKYRPDIVLFVNGIPLGVIECKKPEAKDSIKTAIEQHIRYQAVDGIVGLYMYSQLLMGINKNEAKYATTGTAEKFWAVWKEEGDINGATFDMINTPLAPDDKEKLFSGPFAYAKEGFEKLKKGGSRLVTEQDRAIYCLCRPERLLELMYQYIVYEGDSKKIARYQQYNAVKKTISRIKRKDKDGKRQGGVIWHTQGSGKSLTMVMLAKVITLQPDIKDPKVVVVTDRTDLDDQIHKTFLKCGKEAIRATSGRKLARLIEEKKETIITTLIHKFRVIVKHGTVLDESENIFVLVDEGHRTQYGSLHVNMHRVYPNACYIGFTGTPLKKKEKDTAVKFGGIIDIYNIDQAVKDKAVVPLLYEGRHVEQEVYQKAMDGWWDRICAKLTIEQQADLKHKFAKADQLNKAEKKISRIAYDISLNFKTQWQGTGFKGQLATDSKSSAIAYKKYLDEFGMVSSEVVISPPDVREGYSESDEGNKAEVKRFWDEMMKKYKNEDAYNKEIIGAFKGTGNPEIIIVVDKLLTGFDAPRNTVLYIARNLREHTLLQAIARVNRLFEGKEFGYVLDYYGILGELDQALTTYGSLDEFDDEDLESTLTNIAEEVKTLAQRHSDLWDIFKTVGNKSDEEAYEQLLADQYLREQFYKKLTAFGKTLKLALGTVRFVVETDPEKIDKYQADLKFFVNLRSSIRRRYSEVVDYGEYEGKIQKLINEYVVSEELVNVTNLVNIFEKEKFDQELTKVYGKAGRADTIATRTRRAIDIKMDEDPAFYKKFSEMLAEVIENYRRKRIDAAKYLLDVTGIMEAVRNKQDTGIPDRIQGNDEARAYYGLVLESMVTAKDTNVDGEMLETSADAGIKIQEIIAEHAIVDWTRNTDVLKAMEQDIDDYLFDLNEEKGLHWDINTIDSLMENLIQTAKNRVHPKS